MNTILLALLIFVAVGVGLWLVSLVMEALRRKPRPPATLRWSPDIPIQTIDIGGAKLRYMKSGKGPVLILLHTLRTQLDLFEKVVPELSKHFTVYALDYPGHGYSDIPQARYNAAFFTKAVEGFLDKLDLRDVTLAGVSIGGAIALIIAARRNPRVARVVSINPYDYAKGRGMGRAGLFGAFVTYASLVPVVGETVMRLRNSLIMNAVLRGGVADANSISPGASERNVSCRESLRALPRILEPAPKCRELGGRDQGLWAHRNPGPSHLGRPGLGAASRARARSHADPRRRDDDG